MPEVTGPGWLLVGRKEPGAGPVLVWAVDTVTRVPFCGLGWLINRL